MAHTTKEIQAGESIARYQVLDVTQLEETKTFMDFAVRDFGRVNVVFNNAGVMPLSVLGALKVDEWDQMSDVNIRGVLYGVVPGLPLMKQQGSGQFVNVSSVGGHCISPTAAIYYATKFAVNAISEGLRQESSGIRVTLISPGVTESELAGSISDPDARAAMVEYRKIAISAEAVARAIGFATEQPSDVDVSEIIVRPTATQD